MDTLPLPPRPDLAQYRKRAKGLVSAARSGADAPVKEWAAEWIESLRALIDPVTPFVQASCDRAVAGIEQRVRRQTSRGPVTLATAQFLIAEAHGFASWADLSRHIEGIAEPESQPFEAAADAIVEGKLSLLQALLTKHPELIRARSARVHRATLLHYLSANGVEDFRQKTPANAVAIARLLLESGAEVDALAETYGGGPMQTTMNLLVSSVHPAEAGVQPALVDVLLDFGAAIDGLSNDGTPLMTAIDFGYTDAAEALARRGARVDTILAAAGLGRLDLVQSYVPDASTLAPNVRLITPPWIRIGASARNHIELALIWACKCNRSAVAEYLLSRGVSPAATDGSGMTALHWATATGSTSLIGSLIHRGAPLEVRNRWDGTVLDAAVHFALRQPVADVDYAAVVEQLLAAGADPRAVSYPTGDDRIDAVLARYHDHAHGAP